MWNRVEIERDYASPSQGVFLPAFAVALLHQDYVFDCNDKEVSC